ncbi:MAG TPA: hypothetical protein VGB77_14185 [Abditibacteriaceae bacterium]|jgi:hypothetical protein
MKRTRLGAWEFYDDGSTLTYRLTATGLIPGILVTIFAGVCFALMSWRLYQDATSFWSYLWSLLALGASIGSFVCLFHHSRSRLFPYVLNKRAGVFSNSQRSLFALRELRNIEVVRVESSSMTADIDEHSGTVSYNVNFVLHDGEIHTTYIGTSNREQAYEFQSILCDFLGLKI